jgi:hypothetical protein
MAIEIEQWECAACGTMCDTEDEAAYNCCPPTEHTAYECETCSAIHDNEDDANECCKEEDEE